MDYESDVLKISLKFIKGFIRTRDLLHNMESVHNCLIV